jgi:hypothetical protein
MFLPEELLEFTSLFGLNATPSQSERKYLLFLSSSPISTQPNPTALQIATARADIPSFSNP